MGKARRLAKNQTQIPLPSSLPKAYQVAILVILNCLIFLPSLGYEFTGLDDTRLIVQRAEYLRQPSTILDAFKRDTFYNPSSPQKEASIYYRPIETLLYMWDFAIGGQHPFAYHLTNIVLHIVNCILVLYLLHSLAIPPLSSFWGASVFAVHPLLAQAVAWIPGRIDSLPGLFVFSSMIFFIRYLRAFRAADLFLHVLFFALGLFTKESAIVTPLVAVAYYWAYVKFPSQRVGPTGTLPGEKREIRGRLGWTFALYLMVLAIWYVLRSAALSQSRVDLSPVTFAETFIHNLPIYLQVLQKIFIPLKLSPLSTPQDTDYALFLVALLAPVLLFLFSRRVSWEKAAFGFLWFNAFLLPTLLVPIMTGFENRIYVPMLGFLLLLFETDVLKRLSLKRPYGLYGSVTFLAVLFILNLSHVRSFKNGYEFWKKAAENSPRSSLGKLNYGFRLMEQGRLGEALKVSLEGIKINPLEPKLHNNIGVIFARTGKRDLAEEAFKKEIELNPGYSDVYFNLGILYSEKGDWSRMEEMWRKTLEIDPHHEMAKRFLTDYQNKRQSIQQIPAP